MLDELDRLILDVTYTLIDKAFLKRTTGSDVWNELRDFSPPLIPARLSRLVSLGLLAKDKANSSSRYKSYRPTDAGYKEWQKLQPQSVPIAQ